MKDLIVVLEIDNPYTINSFIRVLDSLKISQLCIVGVDGRKWTEYDLTFYIQYIYQYIKIEYFDTTEQCLQHLIENRYASVMITNQEKNLSIYKDGDVISSIKKIAIWFTTNPRRISNEIIFINLEMYNKKVALNLEVSSYIVLYEICYHRQLKHKL